MRKGKKNSGFPQVRVPVTKPGHCLKSKKDYDRKENGRTIEEEFGQEEFELFAEEDFDG